MRWLRTAVLTATAATLAGCGSEEDRIPLVTVSGKITQDGKPLSNAKVEFVPEAGNPYNTPGVDVTGSEGNYQLRFKTRTGVSAGKYRVVVTPEIALPAEVKIPDEFKDDPIMAQMSLGIGVPGAKKPGGKAAPEPVRWDLTAEVEAGKSSQEVDFDVKKADARPAGGQAGKRRRG